MVTIFFTYSWFVAAFAVFLAATLQAVTGFGFSLLATPMLLLIFNAKTAVGINIIISFFTVSIVALRARKSINIPVVKNLITGAIISLPLGIYVFFSFSIDILKLFISSVTFLLSIFLIFGIRINCKKNQWLERLVGGLSGFLTGSIGLPGPPIILFLNNCGFPKDKFRATTSTYFALIYPTSLLFLIFLGAINKFIAFTALSLLPFALIGNFLGYYLFSYISQTVFQKGVPFLVLITAIYSLITFIY